MATFDFTITDADMGTIIGPPDGFVTHLARTQAGPYDPPQFSASKQCWTNGRFVLRGERDYRDLVCIDTSSGAGWASHYADFHTVIEGGSISYRGGLKVVCVQKGSTWSLTLSDVPFVKAVAATPQSWAEAGQALRERVLKEQAAISRSWPARPEQPAA